MTGMLLDGCFEWCASGINRFGNLLDIFFTGSDESRAGCACISFVEASSSVDCIFMVCLLDSFNVVTSPDCFLSSLGFDSDAAKRSLRFFLSRSFSKIFVFTRASMRASWDKFNFRRLGLRTFAASAAPLLSEPSLFSVVCVDAGTAIRAVRETSSWKIQIDS